MSRDDSMDVAFTDLDLNREPENPNFPRVSRFTPLTNETDRAQERVEERIRQLEAVVARARQRQRWRASRNNIESTYFSSESNVAPISRSEVSVNRSVLLSNRNSDTGKGCKRDSSHLIAKALGIDSEAKICEKEGGRSFYDCNICLDIATDPVLTSCGHLFCWACFYQVAKVNLDDKECPVCKGKVSDNTVIPIYGNSENENVCETTELGLKIPPRPKGQRIESVRQQMVSNSNDLSHSHVLEALRQISITIRNGMGNESRQESNTNNNSALNFGSFSQEVHNEQSTIRHGSRIQQVSRVLSESAASLSSLSSALSSAERLVEDLETVINSRISRNVVQPLLVNGVNSSEYRNDATSRSINNHLPSIHENFRSPIASSPESIDMSNLFHVLSLRASGNSMAEVASSSSSSPSPVRRRRVTLRSRDRDQREARRRLN